MKIYHKYLLYQNKWIHPYVRIVLNIFTSLTYLASLLVQYSTNHLISRIIIHLFTTEL